MNTHKKQDDVYEERLLAELRRVVAANPAPQAKHRGATIPFAPSWRRPVSVAGGLAAAALATVMVAGMGDDASTAWAVTPNDDGTVTVEINSLSDAEGLERQLREAGVPALVQYLPEGKKCADPPAGDPVPAAFGWTTARSDEEEFLPGDIGVGAPWGEMETNGDDGIRFKIVKDVPEDHSLAIITQTRMGQPQGGLTIEESAVRIEYVEGDESPCEVVDAPA